MTFVYYLSDPSINLPFLILRLVIATNRALQVRQNLNIAWFMHKIGTFHNITTDTSFMFPYVLFKLCKPCLDYKHLIGSSFLKAWLSLREGQLFCREFRSARKAALSTSVTHVMLYHVYLTICKPTRTWLFCHWYTELPPLVFIHFFPIYSQFRSPDLTVRKRSRLPKTVILFECVRG